MFGGILLVEPVEAGAELECVVRVMILVVGDGGEVLRGRDTASFGVCAAETEVVTLT